VFVDANSTVREDDHKTVLRKTGERINRMTYGAAACFVKQLTIMIKCYPAHYTLI
jgi:hypothetical protein